MKKNINKSIRTGILVFTGLLVSYACSDTWDDHYDPNLSTGNVVDATIYQQIKSTNELSDFLEIFEYFLLDLFYYLYHYNYLFEYILYFLNLCF